MNHWQRRLFCKCGWSLYDDGFKSPFFRNYQPCPKCGASCHSLVPRNVRYVEDAGRRWWNPLTWMNVGHWEETQ